MITKTKKSYLITGDEKYNFLFELSKREINMTQAAVQLEMKVQRLSDILNGRTWISEKTYNKIIEWIGE